MVLINQQMVQSFTIFYFENHPWAKKNKLKLIINKWKRKITKKGSLLTMHKSIRQSG